MTNGKRQFTEARCTTEPYDPWQAEGGGETAVGEAEDLIGDFPDGLPRFAEIRERLRDRPVVTLTEKSGQIL